MSNPLLFEVLQLTQGEAHPVARFRTLTDARRYVRAHAAEGPWDIVMPDGRRLGSRPTLSAALARRSGRASRVTRPDLPVPSRRSG